MSSKNQERAENKQAFENGRHDNDYDPANQGLS